MKQKPSSIAALFFRLAGFLLGVVGIILQFTAAGVVGGGFMMKHNWAYFTVQTNVFSTLILGILSIKALVGLQKTGILEIPRIPHSLHLACTYFITITMLGYWLLLAPMTGIPKNPYLFCSTLIVHTLLPLTAIADYVLFEVHGGLPRRECVRWLLFPVLYLISVFLLSFVLTEPYYSFMLGGKKIDLLFPYPFLDPQVVGIWGCVLVLAAMTASFLLTGLLFLKLDNWLAKKRPNT